MIFNILFLIFTSFAEPTVNHCAQYEQNAFMKDLLVSLSQKLSYKHDDFCQNTRIADIYHEQKLVYHQADDAYHPYEFVTIHYWEYSCEYQYNLEAKAWANQSCYSTF